MSLPTIASIPGPTPQTNAVDLASGLGSLVKQGRITEASLAAQLSRPLPSDLRPSGHGIHISASA